METKFEKFTNKPNIVLIQGSPRFVNNCPNDNSKTSKIVKYVKDNIKDANFEIIDLKLDPDKLTIQPCKGCISTAGGAHCHYKCDCYDENNDKMYSEKIYDKLEKSDAFVLFTPIHWYAASSQVKALFDRLVCINQTITHTQAVELFGKEYKNAKLTKKFEITDTYQQLIKNHWEGKIAGFYAFGDDGANDYKTQALPEVFTDYCCESTPKECVMPYVWQMRYSGIDAPDKLIEAFFLKDKICYSCENDKFKEDGYYFMYEKAIRLVDKVIVHLKNKIKVK